MVEMGLLWPGLMRQCGAVLGVPFGIEGLFVFLEAIFAGIYLWSWRRLSGWAHWWSGVTRSDELGPPGAQTGGATRARRGQSLSLSRATWNAAKLWAMGISSMVLTLTCGGRVAAQ